MDLFERTLLETHGLDPVTSLVVFAVTVFRVRLGEPRLKIGFRHTATSRRQIAPSIPSHRAARQQSARQTSSLAQMAGNELPKLFATPSFKTQPRSGMGER
jgi:hypothetical protein